MFQNKDIVAVSLSNIMSKIFKTIFILISIGLFVFECEANNNSRRYLLVVVYANSPQNFSFIVDGVNIGTDKDKLIVYLKKKGAKEIIFKSHYKLDESSIENFETLFHNSNLQLLEFWVPTSEPPGLVNLKSKTNEKEESK